ncbi:MAG: G8 domain-containing protein [Candidatus Korobacteraceae bacterium]
MSTQEKSPLVITHLAIILLTATLCSAANRAAPPPPPVTCGGGNNTLPQGGDGTQDVQVTTGTCWVTKGTYYYKNINVYNGGTLQFCSEANPQLCVVGDIDLWAANILVESTGSMIAGSPTVPFGQNGGTLTIHLWGPAQNTGSGKGDGGAGVTCLSDTKNQCGVPDTIWKSNCPGGDCSMAMPINPTSCTVTSLPGTVNDCFYAYMPLEYDDGGSPVGYFGYKVLGVSYNGTLQLYGKKGATYTSLTPANSGTSWARLTTTLTGSGSEHQFTIDRNVDWVGMSDTYPGDQIVVTSTDYVASHAEQLTIKTITPTDTGTTITTVEAIKFPHYGVTYSLDSLPTDRKQPVGPAQDPNVKCSTGQTRCVETRAAVGLLSRSIRIVSAGDTYNSQFPPVTEKCQQASSCYYFGGHMIARQGFASVQIQGVEFYQMGQGGRIAHYPVHFHMARQTPANTYIADSSIWDSMTRWITVHATGGVTLARNIGYLSIGHGFYLEDATETNNKLYSNLGIQARAAVISPQNPRQVPGILAAAYPDPNPPNPPPTGVPPQESVPYHSDIDHPTVFWITNGWNDFQYNMAAGAGSCGACYWLVPAANSTHSRYEYWWSYASEQKWNPTPGVPDSELARAAMTPLQNFEGNSCTSAENSFNTIGDTATCYGVVRHYPGDDVFPRMLPVTNSLSPDPLADPTGAAKYYPEVSGGGGRFSTQCPPTPPPMPGQPAPKDCSTVERCSPGFEDGCMITALDHYTTSFNFTETNFAAIWLRPYWYLLSNTAITDVQQGGLTFVTGGGYTDSDAIPGHWAIARNDVFVGNTQPASGNPYASNAGPFNPQTLKLDPNFACAKQIGIGNGAATGQYCLYQPAGLTLPISNFGVNQRLFNIYDGPAYEENNAFLDITQTDITDCTPKNGGGCSNSAWMYGQDIGMPKSATGKCYLPNAAIAWKQPNGFYYPPAFHSNNLYFGDQTSGHPVDIRHFVIEPLFHPSTYSTYLDEVKKRYCTYPVQDGPTGLFNGYTDVDRQTELNDDDGSLTGLIDTISVNKDPFFAAPVETAECASDIADNMPPLGQKCALPDEFCGTANTSPYNYVTTVVYPDCGLNCPTLPPMSQDYLHWWANSCAYPRCYGVPLYRQDINPDEQGQTQPFIRMAGQGISQRSTLTVNHGSYYMDTTVSDATQGMWPAIGGPPLKNVFKAKDESLNSTGTYYTFLLFATTATHQTYSLYVGPGFNSDPNTGDLYAVQVDVSSSPLVPTKKGAIKWPWPKPEYKDGILTVTMDMNFGDFQNNYNNAVNNKCKPETFCSSSGSTCSCALDQSNELYPQCQAVCSTWTKKDVACPTGGCYGFAFHLPDGFEANGQGTPPPASMCYPNDSNWNVPFNPADKNLAGSQCYYSPPPKGTFCKPPPQQ